MDLVFAYILFVLLAETVCAALAIAFWALSKIYTEGKLHDELVFGYRLVIAVTIAFTVVTVVMLLVVRHFHNNFN